MPIDYKKYHPDWKKIAAAIRERDGHKCKFCGIKNYSIVDIHTNEPYHLTGTTYKASVKLGIELYDWNGFDADKTPRQMFKVIVLTVAHLDHNIENNDTENLAALCQKCHLTYDAKHHAKNSKATERQRRKPPQGRLICLNNPKILETMEKIVCELMKSERPHSEATHRKIAYMLGTKPRIVESWATRFKESLEQAQMLRNQIAKMVHPETQELLERQKREAICPLPTAAEWREADARSLAAQFGTSEDRTEQGESLEAVFAEVTAMPAIEQARLQEGASARNLVAYQHLANQMRIKYA